MYTILKKQVLNETITLMEIDAPMVAKHAQCGQFIILMVDETGERVPLTIADYDRSRGSVTIIFQKVGASTRLLDKKGEGDSLYAFVGPLGTASRFDGIRRACVIGGGLGVAIAYPQAKELKRLGADVDLIVGFRNKDLIILEEELTAACTRLICMTDDGSNGRKGFVTQGLRDCLDGGEAYDVVIAIGPLLMMKAVCDMTRPLGVRTVVSMNSIMIDGTGMCGGCRVTVDGKQRFACVDGPEFDGHRVDFGEALTRTRVYLNEEKAAADCHLLNLAGSAAK